MTSTRDAFYAERDRRTRQYGGHDDALERAIHLIVGPDVAATRAGQIATLALVNLVARAHRRLVTEIPDVPLRARSLVPADDLQTAATRTALAINPVLDMTAGTGTPIRIGLGQQVPNGLELYLGWLGGRGTISTTPLAADESDPESIFGAATAAVLGAAAVFRLAHDQTVRTARFNPIELAADHDAGTRDHRSPIDVGDVLAVGAGAVTSALVYWLCELGITGGTWDFLDRDDAELHNTNRCMTMTAAQPAGRTASRRSRRAIRLRRSPRPLAAARTQCGTTSGSPTSRDATTWFCRWPTNGASAALSPSAASRSSCTRPLHRTGLPSFTGICPTGTTASTAASPTPRPRGCGAQPDRSTSPKAKVPTPPSRSCPPPPGSCSPPPLLRCRTDPRSRDE